MAYLSIMYCTYLWAINQSDWSFTWQLQNVNTPYHNCELRITDTYIYVCVLYCLGNNDLSFPMGQIVIWKSQVVISIRLSRSHYCLKILPINQVCPPSHKEFCSREERYISHSHLNFFLHKPSSPTALSSSVVKLNHSRRS